MIKNILYSLFSLLLLYFVWSFAWSILNTQKCVAAPKESTCEEIAKNRVENCKYQILYWKKNNYDIELNSCKEYNQSRK